MEKLLAYVAAIEGVANAIANASGLPQEVRDAAQKVVDAGKEVEAEIKQPNLGKIGAWLAGHGNVRGTPESRGEV